MNFNNFKMRTQMRHKRLHLSTIFLLGLGLLGLQAQNIYVKQSSGTQTAYALSNTRKLSFSSGNLTIIKTDNSSRVYALHGLRYLNFTDLATNLYDQKLVKEPVINAYPNPGTSLLNIDLSETAHKGKGTLRILNFEGKTIISRQVTNPGVLSIDISHLPKGFYFCRYSNKTEVTTLKIVKQ